ncbi:hypothetical protein ACQ4LE_004624, partial [Meloidogyne hapla]
MYYSNLFSFLLIILFNNPHSSDAFFSDFFQKIKNSLFGENEMSVGNKQNTLGSLSVIDSPNQFNENNEKLVTEKIQENNEDEKDDQEQQKHLPGGYFYQKYQHFGVGGPQKEENLIIKTTEVNEDIRNQNKEIKLGEEKKEEENEDRLFEGIANWFTQNAAEILTKGKNFF